MVLTDPCHTNTKTNLLVAYRHLMSQLLVILFAGIPQRHTVSSSLVAVQVRTSRASACGRYMQYVIGPILFLAFPLEMVKSPTYSSDLVNLYCPGQNQPSRRRLASHISLREAKLTSKRGNCQVLSEQSPTWYRKDAQPYHAWVS